MPLRVLLAEDEALVAMALADWLEAEGHLIVLAADGMEALSAFREDDNFDVLVTDLRMPRLGGEALIRALWAERPWLPVLVVTGSAPPGGAKALRHEIGRGGSLALLHKPIDFSALADALRCLTTSAPV
ncbi:response regulator [Belnapia sp. T18]|uniref:Response regulator n=1 Tax=Belnapia arida TaxID=2804533 RepID=A0ABS1U7H8_9PROT|nr:response regulator [Belnapia arida]MBL6080626.1 response regulator [Belnapia arida]